MLILLLLLMVGSMMLFVSKARISTTYWMVAVLIGWFISMVGFIIFIAKYGGFYYRINQLLYLNDSIRLLFANSPISIATISRMLTMGRSIFIFSLVGLSFDLLRTHRHRHRKNILLLSLLFALINMILYDPYVYIKLIYTINHKTLFMISILIRMWMVVSLAMSIWLMIIGYRKALIPWNKHRVIQILLGVCTLSLFYIYIIFMGPLQFTDVRTYYFLYHDFSNFNPPVSPTEWYLGIVITGVTIIISLASLWRYQKVQAQWGNKDISMVRRYNTADMGVKVFSHAIKNQLIMLQLLLKNIESETVHHNQDVSVKRIEENVSEALLITQQTFERLDELHKAFQTNQMHFKAATVAHIIQLCTHKTSVLPNNMDLVLSITNSETLILADEYHLSEALSNIVMNAIEALRQTEQGKITISSFNEDRWTVIAISDNGPGIPDEMIDRIFEPFYSEKNTSKSWGIGLTYARQVVNYHFGHIHAKKGMKTGSMFQVFLPIYQIKETKGSGYDGT